MLHSLRTALLVASAALLVGAGCSGCNPGGSNPGGGGGGGGHASGAKLLQGGGSTLIAPLMEKWAGMYDKKAGVRIDYTRAGSGKGISQMTAGTYDFGCTDAPMSEEQLKEARGNGGDVVHIPLALGSVVPGYNLKGVDQLKFSGPVLADIYLGKIKKWNDPALKDLNPGVTLPDKSIVVVHRSEPSGTTFIWSTYLSKVSDEWKKKLGAGLEVAWPVGDGQKGTDGVANEVKSAEGAIGYIEVAYALKNKDTIHIGSIKNKKGKFVAGSDLESIKAAAEGVDIPDTLTFDLTDADGDNAYPVCGATWAVFYQHQKDVAKGKALVDFLRWAIHEGQEENNKLDYGALPAKVVGLADKKLQAVGTPQ
jgi:phosphate transport system substrate-binding protein